MDVIRAIRNHAIEHSTVLWTQTPQPPAEGAAWLAVHLERGPAFVAEVEGEAVGLVVYGPWRELDGYRHTVEDSVHVREGRHGLGVGSALRGALIASAREAGHHVVIAGIEAANTARSGCTNGSGSTMSARCRRSAPSSAGDST
ncbi:N-acetyltransferase family protein [Streptomyces sp. NPDC054834]